MILATRLDSPHVFHCEAPVSDSNYPYNLCAPVSVCGFGLDLSQFLDLPAGCDPTSKVDLRLGAETQLLEQLTTSRNRFIKLASLSGLRRWPILGTIAALW
jgi:hypothetical protein